MIPPRGRDDSESNGTSPESLPHFIYHPDPLATDSVRKSDETCVVCERARGYIYVGPVYAPDEHADAICPWCIADGTARARLSAEFTDIAAIGGSDWEDVATSIEEVVAYRTPGFNSWQGEQWFTHCEDAAAFLGVVGHDELKEIGPEAVEALRLEAGMESDDWEEYYNRLDKDGSPTAYIFRSIHCGTYGGYTDSH